MHDLIIIGGGPVGIYSAIYASSLGLAVHLIEAAPQLGGQPELLYPEKTIYDIPTFSSIPARDYVSRLLAQLKETPTKITTGEYVLTLEKSSSSFKIETSKGVYVSKWVIIATGNGIFAPRKLIQDKGQYANVHYHIPKLEHFRGKAVAVFGGGDSAIDWALMLEPVCKQVILIHRREAFRAHPSSVARLKNSAVSVYTPYLLRDLVGNMGMVSHLVLEPVNPEGLLELGVDAVIVLYGFAPNAGPQKEWGIQLHKNQIAVSTFQESSLFGVFAVGDACHYEGKISNITVGMSEAVKAIDSIIKMRPQG
ncbi:MAG: NAD(P)/FAD-dependent oxidoreductase [Turicibacter sp.]|nr:NAD(P)/FAD-dependent oxidoreductase [Turicibacter sp.]